MFVETFTLELFDIDTVGEFAIIEVKTADAVAKALFIIATAGADNKALTEAEEGVATTGAAPLAALKVATQAAQYSLELNEAAML